MCILRLDQMWISTPNVYFFLKKKKIYLFLIAHEKEVKIQIYETYNTL